MKGSVIKRIALIVVCAVLLLVLVPEIGSSSVNAAEPTTLYVGGVNARVTSSGSGWSYNSTTGTLTLNDAEITGTYNNGGAASYSIYSSGGTLKIVLINSNRILASGEYDTAIYSDGGLSISGSGSLTALVTNSSNAAVLLYGGPFTMSGTGTVTISSENSSAISGSYGSYCDIIVTNGTIDASTSAASGALKSAINAKDISVSGNGQLYATTTSNAEAIYCTSLTANFTVGDTGYVYASTASTTASKKAINATGGVNIISGVITPTGASVNTAKEIRIEALVPVPGPVNNLTATSGDRAITLNWSVPADIGGSAITGYNVYNSSNVKQNSSLITGTTYTVSGLNNGTSYSYYVKAYNSYGAGTASGRVSATPKAAVPAVNISRAGGATGSLSAGETLSCSFTGGVTPSVTYSWQYASTANATTWTNFSTPGYSTASFTIPQGYGGYYVRLSARGTGAYTGQVYSNSIGPIAVAPITISTQPANSYVLSSSSDSASLTVVATTTELAPGKTLVYRWIYGDNGDVTSLEGVSGGNTATLTIAHNRIDTHSDKRFKCIISYADGSGTSVTTDTAKCETGVIPQITVQPSTEGKTKLTTERIGFSYNVTFSALGYPFTTIQWQYTSNPNDTVPTWNDMTVAQGTPSYDGYFYASFRTATTLPEGLYKFRCVVTNNYGTTISDATGLVSVLEPSDEPSLPASIADSHYFISEDGILYVRDDLLAEGSSVGYPLNNSSTAYDANTAFKVYSDKNKVNELTNVRASFDVESGELILSSYPSGYLAEDTYYVSAANSGNAQSINTTMFTLVNKIHLGRVTGGSNNGVLYRGYSDSVSVSVSFTATEGTDFNAGDTWTLILDSATGLTATPTTGSFSGVGGNRVITVTFSNTADTPAGDYGFRILSDGYESIRGTVTVEDARLAAHVSSPTSNGIGDGDGTGIRIQNELVIYNVNVTATPYHAGATYQWQESADSTNGTDGTWTDIPYATSDEYSRTAVMSDSGHWFRCQVTSIIAGTQRMAVVSNASKLNVRYPVNSNWLMVMDADGNMVPVTDDTVLKPGDVIGFQLNAGYGYDGIIGTEYSYSHPGVQEICETGFGMFEIPGRGGRSYISYDPLTSNAVATYTLTTADIGYAVRFYHQFYRAAGTETNSLYTCLEDISFTEGTRELHSYSKFSPVVRGDLTLVTVHNNNGSFPAVAFGNTLTASISGTGASPTATYQWQVYDGVAWSNIAGETSSRYIVGSVAVGKTIRVIATGSGAYDGSVTSTVSGTVTRAVTSVTISNQNPMIGDTLSATTVPSNATVTYEWKANGTTLGTGDTYRVTSNDWKYPITLVVTGSGIYTGSATDTTNAVTKQLTNITTSTNAPLTGSEITTTLSPLGATATYKWYRSTSVSGPFVEIAGATLSSYTPVDADRGQYVKVVATGSGEYAGYAESTPCFVKTAISALSISADSANTATELSVTIAPAGATATYQWYCVNTDTNSGGTAIRGATNSTFMPVVAQRGKYVYCVATGTGNYVGTVASSASGPVTGAVLSVGVSSDSPKLGTSLTAMELPTGATVTWQWYESSSPSGPWTEITGATLNVFTPGQAQAEKYLKVVATGNGSFTGTKEHILTNAVAVPPTITAQTADVSISSGASTSFSVTANGTSPLTYVWQISRDMGATWSTIEGMSSSTLSVGDAVLSQSGELYRCVVSNSAGSATSEPAKLIVAESTLYHWVSGQNGKYTKGGSSGLPFRADDTNSTATVDELAHVYVDGVLITEGSDYTASSGSVIITLTPSFLNGLSRGTHRLTSEYTDGSAIVTGFTVATAPGGSNPNTGDSNTYVSFLILLMLVSLNCAAVLLRIKRSSTSAR